MTTLFTDRNWRFNGIINMWCDAEGLAVRTLHIVIHLPSHTGDLSDVSTGDEVSISNNLRTWSIF